MTHKAVGLQTLLWVEAEDDEEAIKKAEEKLGIPKGEYDLEVIDEAER